MEMPANAMEALGLIALVKKANGSAWLGVINGNGRQTLWEWDGGTLSAARADFVLPRYDAELDALLVARYRAECRGPDHDAQWVKTILERICKLGGQLLQGKRQEASLRGSGASLRRDWAKRWPAES
jgi:hypothetical protein